MTRLNRFSLSFFALTFAFFMAFAFVALTPPSTSAPEVATSSQATSAHYADPDIAGTAAVEQRTSGETGIWAGPHALAAMTAITSGSTTMNAVSGRSPTLMSPGMVLFCLVLVAVFYLAARPSPTKRSRSSRHRHAGHPPRAAMTGAS